MNKQLTIAFSALLFTSAAWAKTETIHFSPFQNGKLKSTYIIKETYKPDPTVSCIDSAVSNRADVYRCFAQNGVYDPCFQKNKNTVVCLMSPWDKNVTQIQTPQPLTQSTRTADLLPWALILQNGTKCSFLMGAMNGINGMRSNYYCSDKTYLYGDIDKTKSDWTIEQQLDQKSKKLTGVIIKKVFA